MLSLSKLCNIPYFFITLLFLRLEHGWWRLRPKVVETDRAKVLWDLQIQADKQVMVNQLVKIDVAVPSNRITRKKETDKIPITGKLSVIPVVIGALGAVTPPPQVGGLAPAECSGRKS